MNGVRRLSWRRRNTNLSCRVREKDLIKILLKRLEVYTINKWFQITRLIVRLINSCKHLNNWIVNTTNDIISTVIVRKAYVGGWCHRNVNATFVYFRVVPVVCCNILCCLCTRLQNVKPIDYFYQFVTYSLAFETTNFQIRGVCFCVNVLFVKITRFLQLSCENIEDEETIVWLS